MARVNSTTTTTSAILSASSATGTGVYSTTTSSVIVSNWSPSGGFSADRRVYATPDVLQSLLRGRWPQGRVHLDDDCGLLRGAKTEPLDAGVIQSTTRSDNWFMVLGGESVGHICTRCARRRLDQPDPTRDRRGLLAHKALEHARKNP
jgi:hypothetical protein